MQMQIILVIMCMLNSECNEIFQTPKRSIVLSKYGDCNIKIIQNHNFILSVLGQNKFFLLQSV